MKLFGLIGYPLEHSFSKEYFHTKFANEKIANCTYENFEMKTLRGFKSLFEKHPNLVGVNCTIPHKENILKYVDSLDASVEKVGAANTIKKMPDGTLKAFNTDFYGFRTSLQNWLNTTSSVKCLVFGSGGASKAVCAVLKSFRIPYQVVSRDIMKGQLTYELLNEHPKIIAEYKLLINTTPLGMFPNVETYPEFDYSQLTFQHHLFDLVYNPMETAFLKKGRAEGASVKNGLEMLHLQAEKAWEIWNL